MMTNGAIQTMHCLTGLKALIFEGKFILKLKEESLLAFQSIKLRHFSKTHKKATFVFE